MAAFLHHAVDFTAAAAAAILLGASGVGVWRWLAPHVPGPLVGPVIGYIAIIVAMVAAACGIVAAGAELAIAVGATAFFLSDLSVARDAFVQRAFLNRAWGLPLYYGAQLILATTQLG